MNDLLLELDRRGIRLRLQDGRLAVHAPKGSFTPELQAVVAAHREGLVSLLQERGAASPLDDTPPPAFAAPDAGDGAAKPSPGPGAAYEILETRLPLAYAWSHEDESGRLRELYAKALSGQWIAGEALPWDTPVDPLQPMAQDGMNPLWGSAVWTRMSPAERERCHHEMAAWTISQFLHGEQGALLATSQLVATVTGLDAKLYGATQVVDEARHVEVFERYLDEKIRLAYPVDEHLKKLLDLMLQDSRWDIKFLGMQVLVEGAALSSLGTLRHAARDPLLRAITHYVMGDEARHIAYGVLALQDHYRDQPDHVREEREDFLYEGLRLLRDRFLMREVWERMGLPVRDCMHAALAAPAQVMFRQRLFARIVPAIKKMGLLSPRQRRRFSALGILQFEHMPDGPAGTIA